uniref:BED-type domain-containing protein n=1 Tax=Erpetoichthys calabaricus TaxID=27687 RepID=A0A8C4TFS3_ERPCA
MAAMLMIVLRLVLSVSSSVTATPHEAAERQERQLLHPPKKRIKSAVWEYFGYPENPDGAILEDGIPMCKICRRKVCARGGNTSNFRAHLRVHHAAEYSQIKDILCTPTPKSTATQSTHSGSLKSMKHDANSKHGKGMNSAVAYFLAKDKMPFEIVESPGFLHLMRETAPFYTVPNRHFFATGEIPKMYERLRASIEEKVAMGVWFSVTADQWTTSIADRRGGGCETFISFTVHYVTLDWQLHSHCLETLFFPEEHTPDNILEVFENMLHEWKIKSENLSGITTGNTANLIKAFGKFPCVWIGCFGDNLNLAISKVLKMPQVDSAVKACRRLVHAFARSWKKRRELKKKQEELNVTEQALIQDEATRWGSTAEMISRFLEQQQAVCAVLATDKNAWHLMLKDTDIAVLEDVSQILTLLGDFTDAMVTEERVTLSSLKPVLQHITTEILGEIGEDSTLTKQMKQVMRDDLLQLRYSGDVKRVLDICCFVDARLKGCFSENLDDTIKSCVEEAMRLAPHEESESKSSAAFQDEKSACTSLTTKRKNKTLSGLLRHIISSKQDKSEKDSEYMEDRLKAEVKLYLSLPSISIEDDPLAWWKVHTAEMPLLSNVAQKYLSIPATSVPSARLFTSSGHTLSLHRSGLSPEHVNMLTFLHHNLD